MKVRPTDAMRTAYAKRRRIVVTDLDGTLLDFRTYSSTAAEGAVRRLSAAGVPVVFCSSKTAGEQRPLRARLGLDAVPFIVENGAAVVVPEAAGLPVLGWKRGEDRECVQVLGRSGAEIRAAVAEVEQEMGKTLGGFGRIGAVGVAALTGLDAAAAARAVAREYSETLTVEFGEAEWREVEKRLAAWGLAVRHGGRFHTVTGAGSDKGRATQVVTELYAAAWGARPEVIGLGDSANDAPLLAAVDRAFLLRGPEGQWAGIEVPGMVRIDAGGGVGWAEAAALF